MQRWHSYAVHNVWFCSFQQEPKEYCLMIGAPTFLVQSDGEALRILSKTTIGMKNHEGFGFGVDHLICPDLVRIVLI